MKHYSLIRELAVLQALKLKTSDPTAKPLDEQINTIVNQLTADE